MTETVAIRDLAGAAVSAAMTRVLPEALAGGDPLVRRSEHADFQSTVALVVAKAAGRTPGDVARALAGAVDPAVAAATVTGPGFLNLMVADASIWARLVARLGDDRLGVGRPLRGDRVVVDYSGPNIAKEMHVGHLRTTIIGDALARVLAFLGADVVRQNHLGDWGTQFGMLIQYLDEEPSAAAWRDADVAGLEELYRRARVRFEADPAFVDRARARVVALQSGDTGTVAAWRDLVEVSERAFQTLYRRLGVLLTPADSAGESRYNPHLAEVCDALAAAGIAVDSDGALCVFFDGLAGPGGDPVPLIVRKKDGGFGYAATDLATIRYRVRDLGATRVLYVVDSRQALHFRMVFDTARRAGWLPPGVDAVHVPFGAVLDTAGRPFRTRAGGTVRLRELLDAAVARARAVVLARTPDADPSTLERLASALGIGAVKYADLSTSRTRDYTFDVDRMVSLTGNTGVYLQYAYARVRSILGRLAAGGALPVADPVLPGTDGPGVTADLALRPAERALALALDGFADALREVADTLEPHRLCAYLFGLARAFTQFYDACPVLRAPTPAERGNRAALCELTGRTLATGLDLLGIETPYPL
jgi:arginyl-tRNA synthetase